MAVTFTPLDYIIFAAILILSALIGVYYMVKERRQAAETTADDFLMGGRDVGVLPVAMSLIASYMGAITVLGIPTEMYVFGTQYWLVAIAGLLTYPVAGFLFLPFFHRLSLPSAYKYLELRFNRLTRVLAAILFVIQMLLYMGVVLYAPSLALSQVTGLSLWGSILAVGCVVTFYTSVGGLLAVVWTDTFQTIVVIIGLIAVIAIGSNHLGGLGEVWRRAEEGGRIHFFDFDPNPFQRVNFWSVVFGSFVGQLTIYASNPTMLQRYMCVRTVRNSQIALLISLPATLLLVSLVCVSGLVIYAAFRDCDPLLAGQIASRDQLLPYFVMETMSQLKGVPGLFVACIFAASLSSVSSCLNAISITLLEDILKPIRESLGKKPLSARAETRVAKFLGVLGGSFIIALAFLMILLGDTVLQIMITSLGMGGGPLLGLFFLGMFFPCVNAKGATVGLVVSTVATFWIAIGSFVVDVPQPTLPFSTRGCQVTATSAIFNDLDLLFAQGLLETSAAPRIWEGVKMIYSLSFLWYPTLSLFVALTSGILTSWMTGWSSRTLPERLVYPAADRLCCCLPSWFRCREIWTYVKNKSGEDFLSDEDGEEEVLIYPSYPLSTAAQRPEADRLLQMKTSSI